jgi:hypothetical protein
VNDIRSRPGFSSKADPNLAALHHITDWVKGGKTNIDTLALACGHDNNERIRQGWYAIMLDGVPHWVPPPHIDRERRPQRNRVHRG